MDNDLATSRSGSERSKASQASSQQQQQQQQYQQQQQQQQNGIARLAEAAGAQMRRLRRNFSVKNKETALSNNNSSLKKRCQSDGVGMASVGSVVDEAPSRKNKSNTWALRHFTRGRRVTVAGVPKASTFYFNLNDSNDAAAEKNRATASASAAPDLESPQPIRTSSATSLASSTSSSLRPKTAPPAPPPPARDKRPSVPITNQKKPLTRLAGYPHGRLYLDTNSTTSLG